MRAVVLSFALLFVGAGCTPTALSHDGGVSDAAGGCAVPRFGVPQAVTLQNYALDAMEPFLTRDGTLLLFNDSNAPGNNTQLHFATRIDDLTFHHEGEINGTQTPSLEGVPSVANGVLYFVSTRSYDTTFSTLYRAAFDGRTATAVELVPGVSRGMAPWVNFDAEIAASGDTLYFVDGRIDPTTLALQSSDLVLATRTGNTFARVTNGQLDALNTDALEYAPSTSADARVMYFTRVAVGSTTPPRIFVAARPSPDVPFCTPTEVLEATGFVEGPTVAPDGAIYYHHRDDDGVFRIWRLPLLP